MGQSQRCVLSDMHIMGGDALQQWKQSLYSHHFCQRLGSSCAYQATPTKFAAVPVEQLSLLLLARELNPGMCFHMVS